jgi:hypothetical protein
MSQKRQKVTETTLSNFLQKLESLPEKKPSVSSVKELIYQSLPTIEKLFEKGYSAADVVKVLSGPGVGVKISLATFHRHLKEAREANGPAHTSKIKSDIQPESKPEIKIVANIEQEQRPRSSSKFLEMSDDL